MAEDTRGLAHTGALAGRRDVRCRSAAVRVTDTHWVRQDIAMDSAGPRQHSKIVRVDIDDGHLGIEGRRWHYSGVRSLGQAEISGLVECWCRNVLVHRHEDWDRRGLAGFYYHGGQHHKARAGEAVAAAAGTYEEVVAESWDQHADAVYGTPNVVSSVPDPIHPSL